MRKDSMPILVLAAAAIALPILTSNPFHIHIAVMVAINLVLVTGLSIVARTGRLSMGHSAFAAIGAYSTVLLVTKGGMPWLMAVIVGLGLSMVVAFLLGRVIVRLRGVYFVLVTFAFAEFVRLLLLEWPDVTGGASGIAGIPPINVFDFAVGNLFQWYALIVAPAVALTFVVNKFFTTPEGVSFLAADANPELAEATGIPVASVQLAAFVIGATITAFGGILYGGYLGFLSPESFNVHMAIGMVTMLVVGGVRSSWGPVLGAIILTPLPEFLRGSLHYQHLIYGVVLVVILVFLPRGASSFGSEDVKRRFLGIFERHSRDA
ncbi:branched-chain amino acid ABC transporter permease [Bradyrhizobium denitrificans]